LESFLKIRRIGMDCQARGTKVRIIHHPERQYPLWRDSACSSKRERCIEGVAALPPPYFPPTLDALGVQLPMRFHAADEKLKRTKERKREQKESRVW
jgi:hypothetical protein